MAEDDPVDDETLSREVVRKCPNYNLEDPNRRLWIFTTARSRGPGSALLARVDPLILPHLGYSRAPLPWMTGTAVNPLLRAAYLTRGRPRGKVTLGVPWIEEEDQDKIFPKDKRFASREEQAVYVREWLVNARLEEESRNLELLFYAARYHDAFGSIFPMGDLAALVPDEEADVAVLEEPEHLNFFRAEGVPWLKKFDYVVGIIHTNYGFYARGQKHGVVKKPIVKAACAFTVRAHCHRIIKLSDALQGYAKEKEMVENVHGVRNRFLEIGEKSEQERFSAGAYFIGKVLWTKGIDMLLALMHHAWNNYNNSNDNTDEVSLPKYIPFPIVIYGNGPDLDEVKHKAQELDLPIIFHDAIDHAELGHHKVFVNPSRSEVLCTTIAEALAMGKWVVCAHHPSNDFFIQNFSSCLSFSDEQEFMECMEKALSQEPPKLSMETRNKLSWAVATDRLLAAASRLEVPGRNTASKSIPGLARLDRLLGTLHGQIMKGRGGDRIREVLGGGPVARQASFIRKQQVPQETMEAPETPVEHEDEDRSNQDNKEEETEEDGSKS